MRKTPAGSISAILAASIILGPCQGREDRGRKPPATRPDSPPVTTTNGTPQIVYVTAGAPRSKES